MTSPADLSVDYTGGILAPNPSDIGLVALVDDAGTNLRYGRTASPTARDANGAPLGQDQIDVISYTYRFQTPATVAPVALAGLGTVIPIGHIATIRAQIHGQTAGDSSEYHRWIRQDFINRSGTVVALYPNPIEEVPAIPGIAVASNFDIEIDRVFVGVVGPHDPAAVSWLVVVESAVYAIPQPP